MENIEVKKLVTIYVTLGEPYTIGEVNGEIMEVTPVTGGRFEGDKLKGKVCSFGGDWGFLSGKRLNRLNNRFILETDDRKYIAVETNGYLCISEKELDDFYDRDGYGNTDYYFRETVKFAAGSDRYRWLNDRITVSEGFLTEDGVRIEVYEI